MGVEEVEEGRAAGPGCALDSMETRQLWEEGVETNNRDTRDRFDWMR